ncbi:MAG: YecR family lipoprotein [Gammaproteobacteria bacterium]|nr:YecR family lipoprotein [Gammaproteobacteria bacterium]
MKNSSLAICLSATLALTGCATTKTLQPISGSKADGTVTLAYEYGMFESPTVDWNRANITAKQRCAAWGFNNAQAFGNGQSQCTAYNQYGCTRQQVNVVYQCTK